MKENLLVCGSFLLGEFRNIHACWVIDLRDAVAVCDVMMPISMQDPIDQETKTRWVIGMDCSSSIAPALKNRNM